MSIPKVIFSNTNFTFKLKPFDEVFKNGEQWQGFYIFHKQRAGQMPEDYTTIAYVRFDILAGGVHKVDVIGQSLSYSEELFRYKDWLISEKLLSLH